MTNGGSGSFFCPRCRAPTGVTDSRPGPECRTIRRRRVCRTCDFRFTTYEVVMEQYEHVYGLESMDAILTEAMQKIDAVRERMGIIRKSAQIIDDSKGRR